MYQRLNPIHLLFICCFIIIITSSCTSETFFSSYENAEAVKGYVLSKVQLNSTSDSDIMALIDEGSFGEVDCYYSNVYPDPNLPPSDTEKKALVCVSPTGQTWWVYNVIFYFEDNILTNVSVERVYQGL